MTDYVYKICKNNLKKESVFDCLNNKAAEYKNNLFVGGKIRLDNKTEIIATEGFSVDSDDLYIVAALYKKYGSGFLEKIYGSFSFIIHDLKNHKFFYIRDHFGQSSAFYANLEDDVIFSSRIECIFKCTSLVRAMNVQRVIDFIAHTHSCSSESFFKGVFSLRPSYLLSINKGLFELSKYYDFKFTTKKSDNLDTQKKFFNAVRQLMNSRTSTMLSGGIDSTSITAAMAKLNFGNNTKSFSIVFPNLRGSDSSNADEKKYIDSVAKFININSHQIPITKFDFVKSIKTNIEFFDEPVMATNTYIYEEIFKEMNKQGYKRILDGTDGDSVISHGIEIFRELGEEMKIAELLKQKKYYDQKQNIKHRPIRAVFNFSFKHKLPKSFLRFIRKLRRKDYFVEQNDLLSSKYKKNSSQLYRDTQTLYGLEEKHHKYGQRAHYSMIFKSHWDSVFNILNSIGRKYDVEIAFPFFNKPLVEHCLNIATTEKIFKGTTRHYFRESMRDFLPKEIYERNTKSNLSPIFIEHFMQLDPNYINQVFNNENSPIFPLLNQKKINALLLSTDPKKNLSIIYSFITLYEWMKKNHFSLSVDK